MLLLGKPNAFQIQQFLESQKDQPFSYSDVRMTLAKIPRAYVVDSNRALLGRGRETFARAVEAIRRWEMFNLGWVRVSGESSPEVGMTVAVLARHLGFYSLNACRVVSIIDVQGPIRKYGFAYGTLIDHAELGEERFSVEWNCDDDSVWYDILAASKPNHILAKLGYPIARYYQRRFARDSKRAMIKATAHVEPYSARHPFTSQRNNSGTP